MTDDKKNAPEPGGTERAPMVREIVQNHRYRYRRIFRRRWGKNPPTLNVTRIALFHADSSDRETALLVRLLGGRGATVDEWNLRARQLPAPPESSFGALVVAAESIADVEVRDSFRAWVDRAIADRVLVAATARGVRLLAEERFLDGRHVALPPSSEESLGHFGLRPASTPVNQDGGFLTCADSDHLEELVGRLLDQLKNPPEIGDSPS